MLNPKKIIVSIFFTSLAFSKIFAGDTLYFAGSIMVAKSSSYKYLLRFTVNDNKQLTGYSLTDPKGPNETKAKITGSYDSVAKTISFEEKSILRASQDVKNNSSLYVCFVKATLQLKKSKLFETLSGKFNGFQPGNATACASGEIRLINTDRVRRILEETQNKTIANTNDSGAKNLDGNIVKVFDNRAKTLDFTGNYIKFIIWDNGQIDGDRISLMVNNKYLLQNYTLDSTVKIIETTLPPGSETDTVKIFALNEGTLPPNTGIIKIQSATEQYPIEVQAKLNEVRTVYLRRKKQ
jgi:hypothetical protein